MTVRLRRLGMAVLASLLGCSGSDRTSELALATASKELNAPSSVTILHVNDSHSVLDAIGPKEATGETTVRGTLGGLTKAASVIAAIRGSTPNTLLLHAGDAFEGDLTFVATRGALELALLKQLGVDAFTLGNHEFDYGPSLLAATLREAGLDTVPVLSANLVKPGAPHPLSTLVTSRVVKEVGATRIGIFGLTTPTDPLAQTAPFTLDADVVRIAAAEVAALRTAGADVVILLSHLEASLNEAIARVPNNGIDFIVAGHDEIAQTFKNHPRGRTSIVQAGHFYQLVGRLDLVLRNGHIVDATHTLIPVGETVDRLQSILEVVQGAEQAVNTGLFGGELDAFHTPVAVAATDLGNLWSEEMGERRDLAVGSLAADALQAKFGAKLGATTSGFLNDKIYQGPVVANDLFRALPYGINPVMLGAPEDAVVPDPVLQVLVSPMQLYAGFEAALAYGEIPQVSEGARVCFDLTAPEYARVRFVLLDGAPVLPEGLAVPVAMNIIVWQVLNEASRAAGFGEIPLPTELPEVTQFQALLEFAIAKSMAGEALTTPAAPRVKNLPGDGCQSWLMQLLSP